MSEQCAFNIGRGEDRRRCPNPAAYVYVNGAFRRLECDDHASRTRQLIRYPTVIRLEPLAAVEEAVGGAMVRSSDVMRVRATLAGAE